MSIIRLKERIICSIQLSSAVLSNLIYTIVVFQNFILETTIFFFFFLLLR